MLPEKISQISPRPRPYAGNQEMVYSQIFENGVSEEVFQPNTSTLKKKL